MSEAHNHTNEVIGFFSTSDSLQEAVRELEATSFPRDAITVLGSRKDIEEKFGHVDVSAEEAAADADTPRDAPVRPEEKTIGTAALISGAGYIGAMGAALATGGAALPVMLMAIILGGASTSAAAGLLANRLKHQFDEETAERIARGGLVLWVRAEDDARKTEAYNILQNYGATDIKVY